MIKLVKTKIKVVIVGKNPHNKTEKTKNDFPKGVLRETRRNGFYFFKMHDNEFLKGLSKPKFWRVCRILDR